jgi:putative MATE family efflux protein
MLGAPADLLPMIQSFMTILYSGVPFVVVGMVGMASMRATGDTRLPGTLMVLASVINVILDPIFIFGVGPVPAMGLDGAAVASLLARGSIFVITIYLMRFRLDMISFNLPQADELKKSWRDILHVGIPAAGTNVIVPLGTAIITAMIANYGQEAVAGFGVAIRVESMMLVIYYAMSSVIGPFVGQNYSAGHEVRIQQALNLCAAFCFASGIVIALLLAGLSGFLPSLFSQNEAVVGVTELFLLVVPISYGTYGMVMVMNASFNGLGKPLPAVWISLARMLILYVPLAFLARAFFGITGIFAAYAIANVLTGVGAFLWAKRVVQVEIASLRSR